MGVSQNREALGTLGLYTDYKGIAGVFARDSIRVVSMSSYVVFSVLPLILANQMEPKLEKGKETAFTRFFREIVMYNWNW